MVTEPSSTSQNIILYGEEDSSTTTTPKHVIVHIDFSTLGIRECFFFFLPWVIGFLSNLIQNIGSQNDFEVWTPDFDEDDNDCLLGKQVFFFFFFLFSPFFNNDWNPLLKGYLLQENTKCQLFNTIWY